MTEAVNQYIRDDGYGVASWDALTEGETGNAAKVGIWAGLKNVQITVVNAAGESVTIQGSLDGITWFTLHAIDLDAGDYFALTGISSSGLYAIVENPLYIRPVMTNVGGSGADFNVSVGANTRL